MTATTPAPRASTPMWTVAVAADEAPVRAAVSSDGTLAGLLMDVETAFERQTGLQAHLTNLRYMDGRAWQPTDVPGPTAKLIVDVVGAWRPLPHQRLSVTAK